MEGWGRAGRRIAHVQVGMATSSQEFGGESHPRAGDGHCRVRSVMPNHPDGEGENDVSSDRSTWEYEERDGFENKTNGSDHLGLF